MIAAIVQARMSSQRLPGKVLRTIDGTPMLQMIIERLALCRHLGLTVVATSSRDDDDPIAKLCSQLDVGCFRGDLEDVASRFVAAAETYNADALVRITGDSPLIDPALVDQGIGLFMTKTPDVLTNVHPRTFPPGQSVEIISAPVLSDAIRNMSTEEREHVTQFFYTNSERYRIVNFARSTSLAHRWMAIDSEDQARRVESIVAALDRPHWTYGYEELLAVEDSLFEDEQPSC